MVQRCSWVVGKGVSGRSGCSGCSEGGVRMLFACSITTKQPINTSKEPINTPEGRVLFVDTKNHIRVPECYVIDRCSAVCSAVYMGVYMVFGGVLDVYIVYI